MMLIAVMAVLLLGNLLQVAIWALLFHQLGEFATFGDAYYHSAVNFATLGYGDIVMSEAHRILGALEAITGILMVGISTAVLMAVLLDSRSRRSGASDS
jgi:voltage-gated potassium channel Kch